MKFRRGNKTCSTVFGVLQFTLPPVVIVFANDLDNITNSESDASFFARNEVILCWIIFKLCSYIYLQRRVYKRCCHIITGTVLREVGENWCMYTIHTVCNKQRKKQKGKSISDSWKWSKKKNQPTLETYDIILQAHVFYAL